MSGGKVSRELVGRAEALAVPEEAWARAKAGRSTTVLVTGEAGIGKSRLVQEFLGRVGDGRVLVGACLELGEDAAAFGPFAAALRGLLREIGVNGVAELLPAAPAELARLLPELGTAAVADEGTRARLFETILVLLEQLATARPLVLVVEDAHWADRSTLDLLTFLVHNCAAALLRSAEHAAASGDRTTATEHLRRCMDLASQLQAAPLLQQAHLLAQRARITLSEQETAPPAESLSDTLGLTRREREILSLLVLGRTNRQIAEELFISVKTASVHVSRILTKLGVANRIEAAATAHRLHLVNQAADMTPRPTSGAPS